MFLFHLFFDIIMCSFASGLPSIQYWATYLHGFYIDFRKSNSNWLAYTGNLWLHKLTCNFLSQSRKVVYCPLFICRNFSSATFSKKKKRKKLKVRGYLKHHCCSHVNDASNENHSYNGRRKPLLTRKKYKGNVVKYLSV